MSDFNLDGLRHVLLVLERHRSLPDMEGFLLETSARKVEMDERKVVMGESA